MKELELINLRKKREKHYLQENGDIIVKVFNDDVHYKKGNEYLEIDNTLINENEYYRNKSNDYQAYFKKDSSKEYIKVLVDDNYLYFTLLNCNIVNSVISDLSVKYENIYNGIDLEYDLLPNSVKENIIMKDVSSINNDIEFIIETNLDLFMQDNTIKCKKNNEQIFEFLTPYMKDSENNYNYDIKYELNKCDNYYFLKLNFNKQWLENAIFPVVIDPTITNSTNSNSVIDTYIYSGDTGVDRDSQDILKVGVEKVNNQNRVNRALIKFDLPEIGTGSQVVNAILDLIGYGYAEELYDSEKINVHQITNDWKEKEANWNNMNNKYNPRVEGYIDSYFSRIMYNSSNTATLNAVHNEVDITNLVRKWYSNTKNYGIMLKANEEKYKSSKVPAFYSKNNKITGNSPKPVLIIQYRNQNGLENYMDYQTQSFSKGNTYVNTYNGNLVAMFGLGKIIGGNLPVNLSIVYNTNDVILKNKMGSLIGFKYNLYQTIEKETIEKIEYLKYIDEDATIHYFLKTSNNVFTDEDGLNLTIEVSNTKYTLVDKNGNKMNFNIKSNIGYLSEIVDTDNNKITITYNSDNLITKVVDSSNSEINITYKTNEIVITSLNEVVTINCSNNKINSITYKLGTIIFTYNNNNLIKTIVDINNQKIKYEYYDELPYRIKKVSQYGINDTLGQYFNLEYGFNATTMIDNKNRITTKTYNSNGNIASISNLKSKSSIKDAYGFISEYGEEYNDIKQYKNKLLTNQIPIKYIRNYLKNSSFESDELDFVTSGELYISSSPLEYYSGFKSLRCNISKNNSSIKKSISVPKGRYYTFSIYMKNDVECSIGLFYDTSDGYSYEKFVECDAKEDWKRESVTIFYPEDATSDLYISIYFPITGLNYFDDMQLEEGEVANNYNMLDDSNFSNGLSGWTLSAYNHETDKDISPSDIFSIIDLEDDVKALKINMNPIYSSSIDRIYNVSGKKGEVYNVSFWYKNEGLYASGMIGDPICNNVTILYNYIDNGEMTGQGTFQAPAFNTNDQQWQYYSASFVALEDFNSFRLSFYQDSNANNMYITNICLIKDVREVNYDYDLNGNVISTSGLDNEVMNYNYDSNNQLIKVTEPKGANFHYEYDNEVTDRVLKGISGTGISNKVDYDTFGNPILTKVENKTNKEIINGLYRIRLKGTNKYVRNIENRLVVKDDDYNHDLWYFQKERNYYKINHSIVNNLYLALFSNQIILSTYQNDKSLFELIKNDNGSYLICLKQTNTTEDKKYIKFDDEYNLSISNLEENDYHYEFYLETPNKKEFIERSSMYTDDGKFIKNTTNSLLNKTIYEINPATGQINSVIDSNNNIINYTYDDKDRLISTKYNDRIINYEYNDINLLSKINNNYIEYNLSYDEFNNPKEVKINNSITLVTNNYESNNGNLESIIYGNNNKISYTYDDYDRINTITKDGNIYNYRYDNNGNLSKIISDNDSTEYVYDLAQKIRKYKYNNLFTINYTYDQNSNIINTLYKLNYDTLNVENKYNEDNDITKTIFNNKYINYNYDNIGRLINRNINDKFSTNYEYLSLGNRTSNIIKSIDNNNDKYSYRYDKLNNITHIYHNGILENKYVYDEYNELLEENDYINNQNIKYTYDSNGNILSKKIYKLSSNTLINENSYKYTNSNWHDQLTMFNDNTITYDEIGNPLTIGDNKLTWINGRQLSSISNTNNNISYKYNVSGIRTSKTINDTETLYYTEGSHIIFEKTNDNVIQYIRNEIDNLIGFKYNNDVYYYIKNIQNDIIGILDSNNSIVCKYKYDSWGNILSITDSNDNNITDTTHIAYINPYRYRSYYYDCETNLYYLNTRYYNPVWGRFINADGTVGANKDILSYNLYAYCSNNPITNTDSEGNFKFGNVISNIKKTVSNAVNKVKGIVVSVKKRLSSYVSKIISVENNIETKDSLYSEKNFVTKVEVNKGTKTSKTIVGDKKSLFKVSVDTGKKFGVSLRSDILDQSIKLSVGTNGIDFSTSAVYNETKYSLSVNCGLYMGIDVTSEDNLTSDSTTTNELYVGVFNPLLFEFAYDFGNYFDLSKFRIPINKFTFQS